MIIICQLHKHFDPTVIQIYDITNDQNLEDAKLLTELFNKRKTDGRYKVFVSVEEKPIKK